MKPLSLAGTFLALACLSLTQLAAQRQTDPELLRLGNGIAAIAEGQIITVEQLRRELEPIIPRLRVESRNAQEFSKRVDELKPRLRSHPELIIN